MSGFNSARWLVILTFIVMLMNSCTSSKTITTIKASKVPKAPAPQPTIPTEDPRNVHDIPSNPENITFRTLNGMPEYIVGPRDVLTIIEWKSTGPVEREITVRDDGKISFSFLDDITVDWLTPTEIDELITNKLDGYVKNPRIDVVVKLFNSKKASLFGEIQAMRPGKGPDVWPIRGKVRILDYLLEAGGPTDMADLKRVELTRGGRQYKLNLLLAFEKDDTSQNVLVEMFDRILVPKLPQFKAKAEADNEVYVFGQVQAQGKYSFAGKSNIIDVISRAGGLKVGSGYRNIKIIRGTEEDTEVINVNLGKLLNNSDLSQMVPVYNGDIVLVEKTMLDKVVQVIAKINPALSAILQQPSNFRENYTTGGGLRMETDVDEKSLAENERLGGFSGSNP